MLRPAQACRALPCAAAILAACILLAFPLATAAHAALGYTGATIHADSDSPARIDAELTRLKAAGANTVRTFVSWSGLEPSRDGYATGSGPGYKARIDYLLSSAADRGIKVIFAYLSSPDWASIPGTPSGGSNVPADPADFAAMLDHTLGAGTDAYGTKYGWGSKIAAVETWNEPNIFNEYWTGSASTYTALQKAAYTKIKSINPTLPVLASAADCEADGWCVTTGTTFISQMYDNGARGFMDGVAIHFYDGADQPRLIGPSSAPSRFHDLMVSRGDPGTVWITETGFSDCATCVWHDDNAASHAVARTFYYSNRYPYVPSALLYELHDEPLANPERERHFGLLHDDAELTPKPEYNAMSAQLANLDQNPDPPTPTLLTLVAAGPPSARITAGPAGWWRWRVATLHFNGAGASAFVCSLDGTPRTACASPTTFRGLKQGAHRVQVRAIAAAGAQSAPAEIRFTVDTSAPRVRLAHRPRWQSRAGRVSFSASEPGSFRCRLDRRSWRRCNTGTIYGGLRSGSTHRLAVTEIDRAGNRARVPAGRTFSAPTSGRRWNLRVSAPRR